MNMYIDEMLYFQYSLALNSYHIYVIYVFKQTNTLTQVRIIDSVIQILIILKHSNSAVTNFAVALLLSLRYDMPGGF